MKLEIPGPVELRAELNELDGKVTPGQHERWIRGQRCYLCSPKTQPRGRSEIHHVGIGDAINSRRGILLGVPLCRHHHQMVTPEPYLENRLLLRIVALWYLRRHIAEIEAAKTKEG